MATKNIVPRANQEGVIATASNKVDWGSFYRVDFACNVSGSAASSASFGRIDTTGKIIENGTSVTDHGTAMAIVFGG